VNYHPLTASFGVSLGMLTEVPVHSPTVHKKRLDVKMVVNGWRMLQNWSDRVAWQLVEAQIG
jgi:hypothetical protein